MVGLEYDEVEIMVVRTMTSPLEMEVDVSVVPAAAAAVAVARLIVPVPEIARLGNKLVGLRCRDCRLSRQCSRRRGSRCLSRSRSLRGKFGVCRDSKRGGGSSSVSAIRRRVSLVVVVVGGEVFRRGASNGEVAMP